MLQEDVSTAGCVQPCGSPVVSPGAFDLGGPRPDMIIAKQPHSTRQSRCPVSPLDPLLTTPACHIAMVLVRGLSRDGRLGLLRLQRPRFHHLPALGGQANEHSAR